MDHGLRAVPLQRRDRGGACTGTGPTCEAAFDEIMMPLSLSLVERCDAGLRVCGPSQGADLEAARFRASGRPGYTTVEEVLGAALR